MDLGDVAELVGRATPSLEIVGSIPGEIAKRIILWR